MAAIQAATAASHMCGECLLRAVREDGPVCRISVAFAKLHVRPKREIIQRPNQELTCAQFRHVGEPEVFKCMCFVDGRAEDLDGKSSIVEITVEASYLSDPVRQKLIVRFRANQENKFEAVSEIISEGPL